MLSREKGQTSGSRPEAAGLFPPDVLGAREGSVNRVWWAVRNAKDAATIRPTKIPATRARLTRIRAAFPFAYIWGRGTRWSLHPGLVKSITDDFWRSILHDQQYASTELLQNCRGPVPVVLGGGNPLFKPVAYPARDASTDGTSLLREVSFFCPVPPSHRTTGQLYRGVSAS